VTRPRAVDLAATLDAAYRHWTRCVESSDTLEREKMAEWETFGDYAASVLLEKNDA
jgi:hypothetical protein